MSRSAKSMLSIATVGVVALTTLAGWAAPAQAVPAADRGRVIVHRCGDGTSSIQYVPAADFDPLHATPAQLRENGYPTRPAEAAMLPAWRAFVARRSLPWSPCRVPHAGPASQAISYQSSINWSGRVDTGHAYKQIVGDWKVPTAQMNSANNNGHSAAWVGIGSGNSNSQPLMQGGSISYYEGAGVTDYGVWWEVYPRNSIQYFGGRVYPNDAIYAYIEITGSNSVSIQVYDETHNVGGTKNYSGSTSTDQQAEWILERPKVQGQWNGLSAASVHFTSAGAATSTSTSGLHDAGYYAGYYVRMHNCANNLTLATPAALSNGGFDEVITRNHDGGGDHCS